MYQEKLPYDFPFAEDVKESKIDCIVYAVIFGVLFVVLLVLGLVKQYAPVKMTLILGAYSVIALATWLPKLLRCVSRLRLEPEGVRIGTWGLTRRWIPSRKVRFVSAMACSGKNRATGSQILISAYTFEELAKKGGWIPGGEKKAEECARQYLNRYATAYYVRELNLTRRILWLDWSPERLRLIRWMYPDAQWLDFTTDKIYEKQL